MTEENEDDEQLILQKILQASKMLALAGNVRFDPQSIADEAELDLELVEAHWHRIEEVYFERALGSIEKIYAIGNAPYRSQNWRERIDELIERRVKIYDEYVLRMVVIDVNRFQSSLMMKIHHKAVDIQRQVVLDCLPDDIKKDNVLVEALDTALSLDAWKRLRFDQTLSTEEATNVFYRFAQVLLEGHE